MLISRDCAKDGNFVHLESDLVSLFIVEVGDHNHCPKSRRTEKNFVANKLDVLREYYTRVVMRHI